MEISEKIKSLRAARGVSQEKSAQYLGVSYQSVSKWENNVSMPDITLLPDIARFFGISTDELLCVEAVDEKRLFEEYDAKTAILRELLDEINDHVYDNVRSEPWFCELTETVSRQNLQ